MRILGYSERNLTVKIKKINFENNPFWGNSELRFTDDSGKIMDNIILAGENGCGKTQLLNSIYEFSTLPIGGVVTSERRKFTVELSPEELLQIDSLLPQQHKLISPTGEMEITFDFHVQPNYWSRIIIQYQSVSTDGSASSKNIDSSHLFSNVDIKSLFKSIFSTVEINYRPDDTSNITSKEIDEKISASMKSGSNLATEIQQLLIDIQANDANELQTWVEEHIGDAPPEDIRNRRISRFKKAFAHVFINLNFNRISVEDGKRKVYFKKDNHEIAIADLSSGEKQIVFRGAFLLRNQQSAKGSLILIDEPEISLHPAWQAKIFDYYQNLFVESNGTQTSQIFMATHSQYVLHSALKHQRNTLIVLLRHTETGVEVREITAPLVLPAITSAELNYVAFNIVSNDYHIELYGQLQNRIALSSGNASCSVKECDTYITQQTVYNPTIHSKPSTHTVGSSTTTYQTLSTYIRNAIDHPDSGNTFTQEELRVSIELLILLCR